MGKTENAAMILILFAIIGVIFAMIEYSLYNMGIVMSSVIDSTMTLYGIMIFTVFIFEICGVVIAASQG